MNLTAAAFDGIRKAVHDLCGLVISADKQYLVKSRLEPLLAKYGLPSYETLITRLKEPNSLLLQEEIVEAITTRETSFNRDGHPFEELRRTILPELAQRLVERRAATGIPHPRARIWCTAVAHGQEAYSVAMAVTEFVATRPAFGVTVDNFSILATDISSTALAAARAGRYTDAELARGVTLAQKERYFRQERGAWIVDPALRRMIEFRRLNVVFPLPDLGTFDLILCRNLLIYLDEGSQPRRP